eukprot:3859323-Pleurochrysis_carterae.AAC.4
MHVPVAEASVGMQPSANTAGEEGGRTPLSAVDELASVSALRRCPLLIDLLVLVRAVELNSNERRAPSRIVDQLAHHTADVTVPLSVVERTECARTLAVLGVRGEDGPATLTLPADLTTLQSTKKEMLGSAEKKPRRSSRLTDEITLQKRAQPLITQPKQMWHESRGAQIYL